MEKQSSIKEIDFKYYWHHYIHLIYRWKWYVLFAIPLSVISAIVSIHYLGLTRTPSLDATVLIGLDNNTSENTWGNNAGMYQNKERLLLNRSFLEKVANKLSLQLNIDKFSRYELFDSVNVDSSAHYGKYKFEIDKNNPNLFRIKYSNPQLRIKDKIVEMSTLSSLENLNIPGIYFSFSKSFLQNPYSFTIKILSMREVIDNMLSKLKVTSPNIREQTYYFSATLEGTDYSLVSQTVNTIADMFVETNLLMRRSRIQENLTILEKQLDVAQKQLSKSKDELRIFLSANPSIGLSQGTQLAMNEIINLETRTIETSNLIEQSNELRNKLISSSNDEIVRTVTEVITFLQAQGNLSAASIQLSLNQYQQEKTNATGKYDRSHPIFEEIDSNLPNLKSRSIKALDSFIIQLNKILSDRNESISRKTSRMQGLPSKELQLAELQRRQEIDSEIFTSLLAKVNEVKVKESALKPDVFVMDYAVQPIPPSSLKQITDAVLIILVTMLLISFGPAVALDMLDKTVRNEQELVRLIPYRVLISVPKMKLLNTNVNEENKPKDKSIIKRILINDGKHIYPEYVLESFRGLNTKIQIDLFDETNKSIAITSLDMEEGKSTISANLAQVIAQHGINTILIDCDMRKGVINQIFDLPKSPGLSEYLAAMTNENKQLSIKAPLQRTSIPNLWVISCGENIDNPLKLLSSESMITLSRNLKQQTFFVIYDSPPIGIATDSVLLSRLVTRYIIVVKADYTNIIKLKKIIKEDFPVIDNKIMGVVLNMGEKNEASKYYKY